MLLESTYRDDSFAKEALKGEIESTPLSDLFFSKVNMEALQHGIRYSVYVKSNDRKFVIDRQSNIDLLLTMKGIFHEHARYLPDVSTVHQVKRLNEKVLDYVVPRIMSEIDMYLKYRFDVSTMAVPLDRPQIMSTKGSKQLERKTF